MEKVITVQYSWNEDNHLDIPEGHFEALEEDALDRVSDQIQKGYTSGELNTTVRLGKDLVFQEDIEDGLSYSGWWSITTKNKEHEPDLKKIQGFKSSLNALVNEAETIVQTMPDKGLKCEDSQKVCLQNAVSELFAAITGTEQEDLEQ